jgi:DNA invertase Pin-like site-specific DNA recombinase
VRVSRSDQDPKLQENDLKEYAKARSWEVVKLYCDENMSGAALRRPAFDEMIQDALQRRFDAILVWKIDRFGRSLYDCLANIKALESADVRLVCFTQGIDTDQRNPASRFLLQILGAAAEFERELIRDRTRLGLLKSRREGRKPGRKPKFIDIGKVRQMVSQGKSIRLIATEVGVSKSVVQRVVMRMKFRDAGTRSSTSGEST